MTREIVLDTETTSTDAKVDRIIEVGCVELVNHTQTGRTFHRYINPQRAVHPDALAVHGSPTPSCRISHSSPRLHPSCWTSSEMASW